MSKSIIKLLQRELQADRKRIGGVDEEIQTIQKILKRYRLTEREFDLLKHEIEKGFNYREKLCERRRRLHEKAIAKRYYEERLARWPDEKEALRYANLCETINKEEEELKVATAAILRLNGKRRR